MRRKDVQWTIPEDPCISLDYAQLAVLMDLRDELKQLNAVLNCHNFLSIPRVLRRISANTAKPRKRTVKLKRIA